MEVSSSVPINPLELLPVDGHPEWFAVQTRSRHEKKAADELHRRGIEVFLPTVTKVRKWSDRTKKIDFPIFSGYAFVRIVPEPKTRVRVLSSHGVVRFIGPSSNGTPIPAAEIESLRSAIIHDMALRPHPFLRYGQRVRIRNGALAGMEGILVGSRGERQLVISVSTIQRSVAVSVEGYEVEAV